MVEYSRYSLTEEAEPVRVPLWRELLVGVDMARLRLAPVYYGRGGVQHGDGSAVISIPGFMGSDLYLTEFRFWLRRIGYRAYASRIGRNVSCLQKSGDTLLATVEQAYRQTGRRVHLVGHSLGGLLRAASRGCHRITSLR